VAFHVHASNHVLSRRGAPFRRKDQYRRIELPAKSMRALVADHGEPEYAKIDIEGGEDDLVRALFALGVRPRFLSVEAHRIEAFLRIVADGAYDKFQLVEGARVAETYRDHEIGAREGRAKYSFPHHSAGPFGDDIRGEWVDAETMFQRLLAEGLGWKDVHARRREASEAPTRSRLLSLWVRWSRWFRWYRRNPAKRLREVVSSD